MTKTSTDNTYLSATVSAECNGLRLDQALARMWSEYSRSRLKQWVDQGLVKVNDESLRPRDKVFAGDVISLQPQQIPDETWSAEDIAIDVVYDDDALMVVNKAAGMVVHPAAGNYNGTLVNALLHYAPDLAGLPRAGIVHRLDKDTTGLLVIAKTLQAHKILVEQLEQRSVKRKYVAIVQGTMVAGSTINEPIARHPVNRQRMAVVSTGREAITHYRVRERFRRHTMVDVQLETGRTHQIRVHMAHIKCPLLGDPVYNGRARRMAGASPELTECLDGFKRQALHAFELGLIHPDSGEPIEWQAPIPDDIVAVADALRLDNTLHNGI
ncbi:MAG: 23S rRNA pseudouridine(1911/1915/1917) synthase RluD [Gammaproteobacteria bacterium]|nr:23S rRNA pseudouridine(1911/1915/1917) synthase RluD [Gammaproteobacteria bacterium]